MDKKKQLALLMSIRVVAAVLLVVAIYALYVAYGKAKNAVEHSCRSRVLALGKAIHNYAEDYGGYFPTTGEENDSTDSLALLFGDYVSERHVFRCPERPDAKEVIESAGSNGLTEQECDYYYQNGLTADSPDNIVILYDKTSGNHSGKGRTVLYTKDKVEHLTENVFQQHLAKQKPIEGSNLGKDN